MATRPRTRLEQLHNFVERWKDYQSTEMAGAQSFLHHLLECYDALDYAPCTLFEQHPVQVGRPTQDGIFENGDAVTSTERMDMSPSPPLRLCASALQNPFPPPAHLFR